MSSKHNRKFDIVIMDGCGSVLVVEVKDGHMYDVGGGMLDDWVADWLIKDLQAGKWDGVHAPFAEIYNAAEQIVNGWDNTKSLRENAVALAFKEVTKQPLADQEIPF